MNIFQVNQMIKKPEAVLDRLAASQTLPEIPNIALSKFLYCNGQALPLPRVIDKCGLWLTSMNVKFNQCLEF